MSPTPTPTTTPKPQRHSHLRPPTPGSTLASLLIFYYNCFETDLGTMRAGIGFICIVIATLMKGIDVFFHSVLKTPEAIHAEEHAPGGVRYRADKRAIVPDGVDEDWGHEETKGGYDDGGWE